MILDLVLTVILIQKGNLFTLEFQMQLPNMIIRRILKQSLL